MFRKGKLLVRFGNHYFSYAHIFFPSFVKRIAIFDHVWLTFQSCQHLKKKLCKTYELGTAVLSKEIRLKYVTRKIYFYFLLYFHQHETWYHHDHW